ncbi:MAG: acyl-CoA dehydrogenase family protein [Reyranella sp.]|nr:acyl-CoA dehydrogenase family protein [Reyranella sp.]MDP3161544.1 acyl-CoA dehydrogenase family protein [Reyranella sp.]
MSVQTLRKPTTTDWRAILAEIGPQLAEEGARCDKSGAYVGANIALLRENGFFGLAVPVEFGGSGLTRTELAAMLRQLGRTCSSTGLAFSMHTHPAAAQVWRWRNQKAPVEPLLKRIAGDRIQLLTSGGSDWLSGSGTATKVEGGYRISGQKIFASGAPTADLFMTTAVEQTAEGPTVLQFGLPVKSEGVTILDTWDTLGMRGTASQTVKIDNVFIADAAVSVRRPAGKWHPAMHVISMVAFPLVYAAYTGVAEAARDIAVAAAKKRSDPSTVEAVGELENEWAATRIAHDSMVAFGETAAPGPETTNTIFTHRALVARSAIKTVELAMGVAGGASYFRSMGLERLFRDIQGARFHPLTDAPQRRLAGRMALGLPIDD